MRPLQKLELDAGYGAFYLTIFIRMMAFK